MAWTVRFPYGESLPSGFSADLTVAVEVGMVLAALLFIRRVSHTTTVSRVTDDYVDEGRVHVLQDKPIPPSRLQASGRTALFCGALAQPRALLSSSGFPSHVAAP